MSLFKKLFKTSKSKTPLKEEKSKYLPEESLPVDEKFTQNFKNNGGKFLYCENLDEIEECFNNILFENDWYEKEAFCYNENLKSKFNSYNVAFNNTSKASFFFGKCESLVADVGAILISSNQIKEKKLNELPHNFIILATTSQLVETISEGLRKIKQQNQKILPTNITTIKTFDGKKENDFMTYGCSSKNLYLLLLEDL